MSFKSRSILRRESRLKKLHYFDIINRLHVTGNRETGNESLQCPRWGIM